MLEKLVPDPFLKNQNRVYSEILYSLLLLYVQFEDY